MFRLDCNSAVSNELLEALFVSSSRLRKLSIAYAGSDIAVTEDALLGIGKLEFLEDVDWILFLFVIEFDATKFFLLSQSD